MRITVMEIDAELLLHIGRKGLETRRVGSKAYIAMVFKRDIVTADCIRNELNRKKEGKAQFDANDKKRSVAFNNYTIQ